MAFELVFGRQEGRIVSWQYAGEELVSQGPGLNIWRAPTDNDANNWGEQRAAIRWREAGLDRLQEIRPGGAGHADQSADGRDHGARVQRCRNRRFRRAGKRWDDMLTGLGQGMVQFTTEESLGALCGQLGVSYDELEGDDKRAKVQALISELDGQERIPELLGILYQWITAMMGEDASDEMVDQLREGKDMTSDELRASLAPKATTRLIRDLYLHGLWQRRPADRHARRAQ